MFQDPGIAPAPSAAPLAAPTTAPATSASVRDAGFQEVRGGEVYRGETLLVSAYIAIWVLLFAWIALIWKKQASLHSRLDALDRSIDRAIRAKTPEGAAKE